MNATQLKKTAERRNEAARRKAHEPHCYWPSKADTRAVHGRAPRDGEYSDDCKGDCGPMKSHKK